MNPKDSFSRSAPSYDRYSYIQQKVADELLSLLDFTPKKILDLGCGSGTLIRRLNFSPDLYVGIDQASSMLDEHPKGRHIELYCQSFDTLDDAILYHAPYDLCLAASSLQWSQNLDATLSQIKTLSENVLFSIFTAKTFTSLHHSLGIQSPLPEGERIQTLLGTHYKGSSYFRNYTMQFDSTQSLLGYIRQSGVSGSSTPLDYRRARLFLKESSLNKLEFEVLFFRGKPF